jgi:hypothetical protein
MRERGVGGEFPITAILAILAHRFFDLKKINENSWAQKI